MEDFVVVLTDKSILEIRTLLLIATDNKNWNLS